MGLLINFVMKIEFCNDTIKGRYGGSTKQKPMSEKKQNRALHQIHLVLFSF